MFRKDSKIKKYVSGGTISFEILGNPKICCKLENDIFSVEEVPNDVKREDIYKNLIGLVYKKGISIEGIKKKEAITFFPFLIESLKTLQILYSYEGLTINCNPHTKLKYLIVNQLEVFFKTDLELKYLFIPEIFSFRFHLYKHELEFGSCSLRDYSLILFSLRELNLLFSNVLKPMAPRFFRNPEKRPFQRRLAFYIIFIREFYMVTFLQGLRVRSRFLLRYVYYYRCEFLFMINERGNGLYLKDESFNPFSFLFFSFFEFIARNPSLLLSFSDFESMLKTEMLSRNAVDFISRLDKFDAFNELFKSIKPESFDFPVNLARNPNIYHFYSCAFKDMKKSFIKQLLSNQ